MFGSEAQEKKVKVLSGGEKTRLAMIKLLLQPVNFLILDEPTNHLDLQTKHVLKEAIKDFTGTAIIVSHDRDFLEGLVDKVYEFAGGKVREYIGGVTDYLQSHGLGHRQNQNIFNNESKTSVVENEKTQLSKSVGATDYANQRRMAAQTRKLQRCVEEAEKEIALLEDNLASIEKKLAAGNSSIQILNDYEQVNKNLQAAMEKWETASVNLENNQ